MFAVVAAKASILILVPNKIGIGPPIDFYFREKILAIDRLRFLDDRQSSTKQIRNPFRAPPAPGKGRSESCRAEK